MNEVPKIQTLNAEETAGILRQAGLHITADTIRKGIAQGQYPFGTCVVNNRDHVLNCTIYEKDLLAWIQSKAD